MKDFVLALAVFTGFASGLYNLLGFGPFASLALAAAVVAVAGLAWRAVGVRREAGR
jgi:lysozyme family protein